MAGQHQRPRRVLHGHSGATSTEYETPTVTTADNGQWYRAVFTNTLGPNQIGTGTSKPAELVIGTAPSITQNLPTGPVTVVAGTYVSFTAKATGNPTPTLVWMVDNGQTENIIPNQHSNTLSFQASISENGYIYSARFVNAVNQMVETNHVALNVEFAPQIQTQPLSQGVVANSAVTFTAAATANPAVSAVQWQVSTNCGAFTNIPGANGTSYPINEVTTADSHERFRAVFTNSWGQTVNQTTSQIATLTVGTVPSISTQPVSEAVRDGTAVTFTAAASCTPTATVQWQVSTDNGQTWSNVNGATGKSFSFTPQASQSGEEYRAVFDNGVGQPVISDVATLLVW